MLIAGDIYSKLVLDGKEFFETLGRAEGEVSEFQKGLTKAGQGTQKVGSALTKGLTLPILGLGTAAGKSAIDFESAFAGVKKTVDASDEDLKKLETGIRNMAKEIPASATAIAGVAEAAGQLGIQTDNILEFSKVMIDLGNSTNMTADVAATSLARFANITGMSQDNFDKLGSTIVALGNNLATTEAEIVDMSMNLAGAGKQIGLTEGEIMGFAGALSSVGIEAAAGGTAFSKVMIDMQLAVETGGESLEDFAKISGVTVDEFKKGFKDDAAGAMLSFVDGLGKAEENGLSTIAVLDEMGITEVRLRDALLRASSASDVFSDAIDLGNNAWEENIALTKESEQRYGTTESKLNVMKNTLVDTAISIGEILIPHIVTLGEGIKSVAEWFGGLDEGAQKMIISGLAITATFGPVLSIIGKSATGLSSVIGLVGKFSGQAVNAGAVVAKLGTATGGGTMGGLATSFGATALAAAPWIAAIGAVGLVIKETVEYMKEDTIPSFELFDETISEATKNSLGNFMELEKGATTSLKYLSLSGAKVSEELYTEMTTNTNQMVDEVLLKLEEQKIEGLKHLDEYLSRSTEMTIEEKEEAIRVATEKYDKEIEKATNGKARIEEILSTAKDKNIGITTDEKIEIEAILDELKGNSINLMTESQEEQETILNNLKENADRITAEEMAAVVKNSIEQKEKTVEQAELQYEEVLKSAELLKKDGSAESIELANNMIAEAERQRKETVAKAEEMHTQVLAELESQGGDLYTQIDKDNGEIMTNWQSLVKWFNENPIVRWFKTVDNGGSKVERNDRLNPMGYTVDRNASGTNNFGGGLTWVGEQGPEIVELPKGSKVFSNGQSMKMGSQKVEHSGTIRVEGVNNRGELVAIVEKELTNKLMQDNRRLANRASIIPLG